MREPLAALPSARRIKEKTGTRESKSGLSTSYRNLGDVEMITGNYHQAGISYQLSLDLLEEINTEDHLLESSLQLEIIYNLIQELVNLLIILIIIILKLLLKLNLNHLSMKLII